MKRGIAKLTAIGGLLLVALSARAETSASFCGTKPEMVDIMLRMVEEGVEQVAADNRMFVKRDNRDQSLWVITLPNTTAHPAVVCRTQAKEIALLCTAGEKACASFREQALGRLAKIDASGR